eukprot:scaffold5873_cov170-Skeletonema_dohrnii-CCMP3373.AAC.1
MSSLEAQPFSFGRYCLHSLTHSIVMCQIQKDTALFINGASFPNSRNTFPSSSDQRDELIALRSAKTEGMGRA